MPKQDIALSNDYAKWIEALSHRYRQSQIKAALAVNSEMLKFYFCLGRDIIQMEKEQPWGSGFLKRVSRDLKTAMPEAGCFSINNLIYMRCFYKLYSPFVFSPQVEGKTDSNIDLHQVDTNTPQVEGKMEAGECLNQPAAISPQLVAETDHPIFGNYIL